MERTILTDGRLEAFLAVAGRDSGIGYGGPFAGFSMVVGLARDLSRQVVFGMKKGTDGA